MFSKLPEGHGERRCQPKSPSVPGSPRLFRRKRAGLNRQLLITSFFVKKLHPFKQQVLINNQGVIISQHICNPFCISPTYKKRSEEHTSELQSRGHLVCRLLLEKKQ